MYSVLALVGKMDGCALWRILLPFSELQRQGFPGVEWGENEDSRIDYVAPYFNAVILSRLAWPPEEIEKGDYWMRALHKAGMAVIYEVDDDLFSDEFVRRLVQVHDKDPEDAEMRRQSNLHVLKSSDGAIVSNQRLAAMARRYTDRPVKVVENYIDLNWWKRVQNAARRKVHGLTIGWAGGIRPDKDIEQMAAAWGRIAKRYPEVTFVIQGHHAKAFYESVPEERIAMIDWLPIDQYPAGLVNIDIGCCPLADTPFNRAKTPIKAMEYAASGAAVVASPILYNKIIEHGVDGYIAGSVDEWEQSLSKLVEDHEHRRKLARRLLSKVRRQHSLDANAWRWVEAWTMIIRDFKTRQRNKILIPEGVEYVYSA